MIRLYEIRLEIDETVEQLKERCEKLLGCKTKSFVLIKKSIDARKKNDIFYSCTVDCEPVRKINPRLKVKYSVVKEEKYEFPYHISSDKKIIIAGSGPAGLFAALCLAKAGCCPTIIERGSDVDTRVKAVQSFFNLSHLDEETNIQFGEGGAGTFSDGKLNTGVNDIRIRYVLKEFVRFGAPENILYDSAPHIGTDILRKVVKNIRNEIIRLGGRVLFNTKLVGVTTENNIIRRIDVEKSGKIETIDCDYLLLAIGHSARDTIRMLNNCGIDMENKMFSVGVRIEHKQEFINKCMYGSFSHKLPAAPYKLWTHLKNGNSLYTFCMCPGGYVVNSASSKGTVVTNGMSDNARDGENANSAILVNIKYPDNSSVFSGIEIQEKLEKKAFDLAGGNYNAPVQMLGDFLKKTTSKYVGDVEPTIKPGYSLVDINSILPDYISDTIRFGILDFDKKIKGFAAYDSILTAPETRSSSPVKIIRDKITLETSLENVFSAGEGGGHAGGITSSAVDGIKSAEAIVKKIIGH